MSLIDTASDVTRLPHEPHARDHATARSRSRLFLFLLATIAIAHGIIAYASARTKSPTWDEPLHMFGTWAILNTNDFRIDPENPALWHRLQAPFVRTSDFTLPPDDPDWKLIPDQPMHEYDLMVKLIHQKDGDSIHSMLNRRRLPHAILGVACVVLVGLMTRSILNQATGPISRHANFASLLAATWIAFDPTMLGHAPIVKNDVILGFCVLIVAWSLLRIMRRVDAAGLLALALFSSAAPLVKYSGVLLAPAIVVALLARAIIPDPWTVFRLTLSTRFAKLLTALFILILCLGSFLTLAWSTYGFRHAATTTGDPLNFPALLTEDRWRTFYHQHGERAPVEAWDFLPQSRSAHLLHTLHRAEILPEAFTFGLMHVHALSRMRPAFLLGEYYDGARPLYWPVALWAKSPVASSILALLILPILIITLRQRPRGHTRLVLLALTPPILILGLATLFGPMNIGVRHALSLYPILAVVAGIAFALLLHRFSHAHASLASRAPLASRARRARLARIAAPLLVALASLESLLHTPNHLAFFNLIADRAIGRFNFIGNSDLDWGQDYPLLANWQRQNPNTELFFAWSSLIDPVKYNIHATRIPPGLGDSPGLPVLDPNRPGVIAITGFHLVPITDRSYTQAMKSLQQRKPLAVLGNTIFLYRWPFDPQPSHNNP